MNNTITSKSTINNDALEANAKQDELLKLYNKMLKDAEDMENEEIVPIQIDGYEDYYISNLGRVFSKKHQR